MGKRRTYHVCHTPDQTSSGGLFYEYLNHFPGFIPLPSICLQVTILALVPHFIHMVLSRFHQPLLVSQILGGMLASPWILGNLHIKDRGITYFMFPADGFRVVDMLAHFSSMFFIFKVGVQMDPKILKRAEWRTYVIGLCCLLTSYVSGEMVSRRLKNDDIPELKARTKTEGFLFLSPVIAYVLNDLNILNSELGNLALQIAMVADFLHTNEKLVNLLIQIMSSGNSPQGITVILLLLGTLIYIYVLRPVNDIYIALIMISVLLCGLASEYCGLNGTVGAFFLGLAIPDGPPLGSALVHKLRVVSIFFMPLHMGIVGFKTNIHKVDFAYLWRVVLVILCCILGKVIGLLVPAVLLGVSVRDSLLLGLIMNLKGIVEVSQLNTWLDSKLQEDIFSASNTIMVLTLIMVVAVITPAVKYLYDPSSKYLSFKGRSILQSNENNSDFRVLICVHTLDDVPAIIRLLEATDPTKLRPLTIYLLHLVELVGRATPLLIAHTLHKRAASSNPTKSERIINVFQQFQNRYHNLVTVHPFSTISLDKRTALVIFPFCRQDATSLRDDLAKPNISNRCIKTLLQNLLRNSPCSVGILINGSNYQEQTTCFVPDTPYRVIVLYFGGPDDRESLAFAMNMIHNPSVFVTVIRFFDPASLPSDEALGYYNDSVDIDVERQKFLDDELIDHFRINTMHDETLVYKEVEVKDYAETIWVVRQQIIFSGLETDLDETKELGAIGDMVSSPDYGAEGSILIIHQRKDT
ncbi:hypothetical protein MKW92_001598 [Papaver armeniacum]|nr:hypothetical protein MKW92_001598 [Papaver armeniacum]